MATTKIQQGAIADDAITSADLGDDIILSGDYVKVPVGNTATRPSGASAGYIRFNTTEGTLEQYDGSAWSQMPKPPIISTLSYPGSVTAVSPDGGDVVTISGSNFETGVNVFFRSSTYTATYATSVTRTNSTSLSVTTPALTAGDYDVIVENNDGSHAILTSGLTSNAAPSFSTASGSLGSIQVDQAITKITIVASEADSGDIVYTVTTGSLPTGLSLDSSADSAGTISGTPTGYSAETTVNFTITATDDENQTTTRNFSLTVVINIFDVDIDYGLRLDNFQNSGSNEGNEKWLLWSPSGDSNRRTFTWAFWIKRTKSGEGGYEKIFAANDCVLGFTSSDNLWFLQAPTSVCYLISDRAFRDASQWYHIVVNVDTTQGTASDRVKLYVNGSQLTDFSTETYPSQNQDFDWNDASYNHYIGIDKDGFSYELRCHLADVYHLDGIARDPSYFGESKSGICVPKAYSGSYGTNGWYLDFANKVALGNDVSGNNNDLSVTRMDEYDQVRDTPTNSFATMNPQHRDSQGSDLPTIEDGNLAIRFQGYDQYKHIWATLAIPSTGKWYWEYMFNGNTIADGTNERAFNGANAISDAYYGRESSSGFHLYWHGGIGSGYSQLQDLYNSASVTLQAKIVQGGYVMGLAYDADTGKIYIKINGNWYNGSGASIGSTFDADTPTMTLSQTGDILLVRSGHQNYATSDVNNVVYNFGQDGNFGSRKTDANGGTDANGYGHFYYAVPTGFLGICTRNISGDAPSITASDHFKTVLYTGNGTSQSITGVGFKPNLVWLKERSSTSHHFVNQDIDGTVRFMQSSSTIAEATDSQVVSSFDTDGFSVGNSGGSNQSSQTYVAWCWKAGGTAVSNTDGSITSSVSANTTAGFSIVSYTGTGSAATVGHGLSSAPEMVIQKNRITTDEPWFVYHSGVASDAETDYLRLNASNAAADYDAIWNDTAPTSTVVSIGNNTGINGNGQTHIMYCFHSVEGFSKIGSYIGNGSTNGSFVYTGFKPAFVLFKSVNQVEDWILVDSARDTYNPAGRNWLYANSSSAGSLDGANTKAIDFLSNGFKPRTASSFYNTNDQIYIYMAFADVSSVLNNGN